ncbi:MAG TPA: Smr/MutS family protein [Polyangiaceae bacterium]|nr:Smr/MutS family protein [Polyangiaceae bacterium]
MEPGSDRDKSAQDLEWSPLLDRIARHTVSAAGGAAIRALSPTSEPEEANRRATLGRHALALLREGSPIPAAQTVPVAETLFRAERGGVLSGKELADVRRLLEAARVLRGYAASHAEGRPELAAALATPRSLDALAKEIDGAIDESGGVVDDATPELSRARKKVKDARRDLTSRLGDLLNRYGDVLRDRFYTERDGRYVLPVRSDAPFRVDGIVLGSSASGGTLYVEPREITELGNKLQVAEAEVEREIARVLASLSLSVKLVAGDVRAAEEVATRADVLASLARFGDEQDAVFLPVAEGREIDLRTMRHPLLGEDVVPNDVRLSRGRGLVVSGPNAGGKTVALKCLGLAVWMVRAGIPLPADGASRVGFFEPVLTDIGDEQSLERSLSTFSAHSARLAHYLDVAGDGALVLLDEIASGTDPDEGAALAAAVLEALVEAGAAVAVTTHYERLKHLATRDSRFENASVGFDFDRMLPTFRLTLGVPGASSALAVALRYGIPKAVVARAEALIPEENLRRDRLLSEMEADRSRAEADARAAASLVREQEALRDALEAEVGRAREQERARLAREGQDLTLAVKQARATLRDAMDRLKKGESPKDVERSVNEAAREVALGGRLETALRSDAAPRIVLREGDLAPGDVVWVEKLRAHAEVLEAPQKGQVRVAAGPLKVTVKLSEVTRGKAGAKTPQAAAKKPKRASAAAPIDTSPVRTPSITCDVRGFRVDEAVEAVDMFIDRLLSNGDPAGFVLHGHGTGALKSALREHLGAHRCVERARPADDDQGGDAFTVLWVST